MDPDATLTEMLSLARRIVANNASSSPFDYDRGVDLAEKLIKFDDALRGGADLPKPWHDVMIAKVLT
jgi:hypothetical protein